MATLEEHRKQLLRILGDQTAAESPSNPDRVQVSLTSSDFPVPGLLHIAFGEIMQLKRRGPLEKLAWVFDLSIQGVSVSVALEKFGLRAYLPKTLDSKKTLVALKKCCKVVERYLQPLIVEKLNDGKVTLDNQYDRFNEAYQFFRVSADEAYRTPPPPPIVSRTSFGTMTAYSPFYAIRRGGFLASAMLDSYFSMLEHTLVLMAPFTQMSLANGGILPLVGCNWGDKFKLLFDISKDRQAKITYDELACIKEDIRNPTAHGGFLKKGASFHFHTSAGALPVMLTKARRGFAAQITPVEPETYERICEVLDKADSFIGSSSLSNALKYVKSGLPVAMDDQSRVNYFSALNSGNFDEFLKHEIASYDRHVNMDY